MEATLKFDIFCEIQRAEPWPADHEASLFRETLEQAEAADAAGFDVWWEVEHHSAPAFSYSSAPALVLAAIAVGARATRPARPARDRSRSATT